MARKKIEMAAMPKQSKHEKMLSDMHDVLYTLGDKIRKPFSRPYNALIPKALAKMPTDQGDMAKKHIEVLHKGMKKGK